MTAASRRTRRAASSVAAESLEGRVLFTYATCMPVLPGICARVLNLSTELVLAAPTLTGTDPAVVPDSGADTFVGLRGANFSPTSVAECDGVALDTTYNEPTLLTAVVPAADVSTVGTLSIAVVTPGSVETATQTLTVTGIPTVTAMSPPSAMVSSPDTTVTLTGTEFMPASVVTYLDDASSGTGSVLDLGGEPLATTYVSSTQLIAIVPAADLASVGAGVIIVENPPITTDYITQGTTEQYFDSSGQTFTVLTPVSLAAVTPASVVAGSADTTVTLAGTDFQPTSVVYATVSDPSDGGLTLTSGNSYTGSGTTGPTASDGGDGTLTTTYVSPTELTAVVPAADLVDYGTELQLQVQSGLLGNTEDVWFEVTAPPPTLIGVGPASATVGSPDLTITLSGTYFHASSVAEVNGTPLATTVTSIDQMTAVLPAADLATVGTDSLTVVTPDGSEAGEVTAAQTFTVTPPPPGLWSTVAAGTVPVNVATGAKVKGSAVVTLTNTAAAVDKGVNIVELYAVPADSTAVTTGTLLATVKRQMNLAAGASQTLTVPVKALPSTAGTYTLLARTTDAAGQVLTAVNGPSVTVGPPAVSLSVAVSPTTLTPGEPITLTVTVTNSGNVDSTGLLDLTINLSANLEANSVRLAATAHRLPERVKAGGTSVFRLKGKLPAGTPAGQYFYVVGLSQGAASANAKTAVAVVAG